MPITLEIADLNTSVLLPEIVLVGFALLVMFADILSQDEESGLKPMIPWVALLGVAVTIVVCLMQWGRPAETFQGAASADGFAFGLRLVVLAATALAILLSETYIPKLSRQTGEYYALLLLSAVGMMLMGAATDLIVLFLALETFSLALYILAGIDRGSARASEASMKYFLLGAFASSFFVYGAALVYGAAGSTQYDAIARALAIGGELHLLYPGIALLIVGLGFKVSIVPFHMWTPDVYQGSPTPVTAFMSAGTKAAAFAAFVRLLIVALPAQQATWGWALAILAVLTMTLGNLSALHQSSLKRMLAYSSIAHAGYVLVGVTAGTTASANAALFYLFAYTFMNMGALAVVIALEHEGESDALQSYASGLAQRRPALALGMAIFMFGLSGMPPLAGFFGKLFVFQAAVAGGWGWLAVIAMLLTVVGAYYYLRVIIAMYFGEPVALSGTETPGSTSLKVGMIAAALFTIAIGVLPSVWTGRFDSGLGLF